MEGEASGEFQDWELLVNSDGDNSSSVNNNSRKSEEIEADSDDVLRLDYFSLESDNMYPKTAAIDASDKGNPSWIDPGPHSSYYQVNNSSESWSDSRSDRSIERKVGDLDVKNEVGFVDNLKIEGGVEGIGENECEGGKDENCDSGESIFANMEGKIEMGIEENVRNEAGVGDLEENLSIGKDLAEFRSDSGDESPVFEDVREVNENSEIMGESHDEAASKNENSSVVAAEEMKSGGDEQMKKMVWWKVPIELLRFCVFRVRPVWTFSVAAALLGIVILGRRLYKMKRRRRTLPLKVTVEDKFAGRAARLNEAFSAVRRVPIVRPLLPATGVTSWPAMTLR